MKNVLKKLTILLLGTTIFLVICVGILLLLFAPKENTLAADIPDRITQQIQKRHETYVLSPHISQFVKEAAISSQDRRFYNNLGIDMYGTIRALYFTLIKGQRQGASTITEQLAKNVYYHDQDTPLTDLETKLLALFITARYSKDKILEMYLNDIYYGSGAYGIDAASMQYFHIKPSRLNIGQSAFLIALVNSPSYLSIHKHDALEETKLVLNSMVTMKYITPQQASSSLTHLNFP